MKAAFHRVAAWWRRLVEISWEHDPMLEEERFQRFSLWAELEIARLKQKEQKHED